MNKINEEMPHVFSERNDTYWNLTNATLRHRNIWIDDNTLTIEQRPIEWSQHNSCSLNENVVEFAISSTGAQSLEYTRVDVIESSTIRSSRTHTLYIFTCVCNVKHSWERRTKCIIYVAFNKSRERGRLGSPPGAPNKDKTKAFSKWSDMRMYAPMIYGAVSNMAVLSGSERTFDFVRKQLSDDASEVEIVPTFFEVDWFFRRFPRNW